MSRISGPVLVCLLVLIVVAVLRAHRIPFFAGPFRVTVHGIGNDSAYFRPKKVGGFKIKMYFTHPTGGRPQYFWGYTNNTVPLSDAYKLEINIAKRSNNQWKYNYYVMKFDKACSSSLTYAGPLMVLLYGDDGKRCPIKPAYRPLQNKTVNLDFNAVPVFPYGRFLYSALWIRGGENEFVFVADLETVPRV